uniref:Protein kinase domain-containing protein n=1 Tax=Odontella aurita TaxID=265563 RepID=A0A6U6HLE0_9STRA|mmetsp:Transcript_48736/g.146861  ORF Transcript_48736/g.146861 Transcript_48736/m.146861 type:complete len:724 (+) Transcript_48736:229-2400(+)|eukprot:CAMPEP_0113546380 /NCGR_PEP_ID=MMETSP0015_2-20120614/11773_1 /TAXON_ID=2838 /ORGANISM="Odontella" /LENGTH=723 /DNA_ID=CAMNT_0000446827 /DNA_START=158 /DNA_END=2329 /DNA_ORIENTATION=- /assembly_acc=CAM_ASM_000160
MDHPTQYTNEQICCDQRREDELAAIQKKGEAALIMVGAASPSLPDSSLAAAVALGAQSENTTGSLPNTKFSIPTPVVSCGDARTRILTSNTASVHPIPESEGSFYDVKGANPRTEPTSEDDKDSARREHALPKNKMSTTNTMRSAAMGSAPSSSDAPVISANMPQHIQIRSQTPPLQLELLSRRKQTAARQVHAVSNGIGEKDIQSLVISSPKLTPPPSFTHKSSHKTAERPTISTKNDDDTATPPPQTMRPRLSLSAYRKPDVAVRLTHADPTRSIHDDYDMGAPDSRVLGHGASSTVRLAVRRADGAKVAIKTIAKHDVLFSRRGRCRRRKKTLDESDILAQLSGDPHVVGLLDIYETGDEVQLVLEYCEGGELFDAIHKRRHSWRECRGSGFEEVQAANIIKQLLLALNNMHARSIVHRDVKPENVLLLSEDHDDTRVKLSDFGLARVLQTTPVAEERQPESGHAYSSDSSSSEESGGESPIDTYRRSRAYSRVGSDYYTAPEVMSGSGYGTSVDIYSLGVTLYILLCGFPPRECPNTEDTGSSSEDNDDDYAVDFPGSHWKTISEDAKDLVKRMMDADPIIRISAADGLEHRWIAENCKCSNSTTVDPPTPSLCASGRMCETKTSRSRKRSRTIDNIRAKRSRSNSEERGDVRVPPPAFPFSRSVAISMADLLSRVSSIASDASAAAVDAVDLIDSDDVDKVDERSGSPFGSVLTPLSV